MNADLSQCLVYDAQRIMDGPVARITLPERISSGTHSTWAPGDAVAGSGDLEDPMSAVDR